MKLDQYLGVMLNQDGTDLVLRPLVVMNPMGKDQATALLDALLARDADGIAVRPVDHDGEYERTVRREPDFERRDSGRWAQSDNEDRVT